MKPRRCWCVSDDHIDEHVTKNSFSELQHVTEFLRKQCECKVSEKNQFRIIHELHPCFISHAIKHSDQKWKILATTTQLYNFTNSNVLPVQNGHDTIENSRHNDASFSKAQTRLIRFCALDISKHVYLISSHWIFDGACYCYEYLYSI